MPAAGPLSPPSPTSPRSKTSGFAIAALVLGIGGFVFIPVLCSIAAIVFAVLARGEIKRSDRKLSGSGLATAGLALGIIGVVLPLIVLAAGVPFFHSIIRPRFEARYVLLQGKDAADVYYLRNDNSYEGMTSGDLADIDPETEFREAPGNEPEVVYIKSADKHGATLYCYSSRGDRYTAEGEDEVWSLNFHFDEEFYEGWGEFRQWYPFD